MPERDWQLRMLWHGAWEKVGLAIGKQDVVLDINDAIDRFEKERP